MIRGNNAFHEEKTQDRHHIGAYEIWSKWANRFCTRNHKLFSYSIQLSMNLIPLMNTEMPTNVGVLTFNGTKQKSYSTLFTARKKINLLVQ